MNLDTSTLGSGAGYLDLGFGADAGAPLTTATLKLTEGQSVNADNAGLDACSTFAGWKDANPGAWADQPRADCSGAVHLKRDAASTSWTGDVSKLLQSKNDWIARDGTTHAERLERFEQIRALNARLQPHVALEMEHTRAALAQRL